MPSADTTAPSPRLVRLVLLTALTLGALVVHVRRRELLPDALRTLALIALCATVAYFRFGPEAF